MLPVRHNHPCVLTQRPSCFHLIPAPSMSIDYWEQLKGQEYIISCSLPQQSHESSRCLNSATTMRRSWDGVKRCRQWGLLGGPFPDFITPQRRTQLSLHLLRYSFSSPTITFLLNHHCGIPKASPPASLQSILLTAAKFIFLQGKTGSCQSSA